MSLKPAKYCHFPKCYIYLTVNETLFFLIKRFNYIKLLVINYVYNNLISLDREIKEP